MDWHRKQMVDECLVDAVATCYCNDHPAVVGISPESHIHYLTSSFEQAPIFHLKGLEHLIFDNCTVLHQGCLFAF